MNDKKKLFKWKPFLFAIISISIFFYFYKQHSIKKIKDWRSFETDKYFIQYPSNWKLDTSEFQNGRLQVVSNSGENVNLDIQNLKGKFKSLDEFVDISIRQIDTMYANATIISNAKRNGLSGEYNELIWKGDQDKYHFKFKSYTWAKGNLAYILNYTAFQNSFDVHSDTASRIMDNFWVK